MCVHVGVHVWEGENQFKTTSKNGFIILPQQTKYCVDLDLSLAPKRKTDFWAFRIHKGRRLSL